MNGQSRTSKSIHNSIVAMGFLVVTVLLQFYSRKIFLEYLGTEILGLNTTAQNILQFLNIAELGIGAAVGFSLYKPLAEGNRTAINEIVALQGHLYRRIALIIIAGALVVSAFFPFIFHKMQLPLWYAYGSFGALLLSALLGYFVNYRQIVLSSAQMDYKIQYATNSWTIVKVLCQVGAMIWLPHPYEWWLILEVVFALISSATLRWVTRRNFPYLTSGNLKYSDLRSRYSIIITKIKQLFVHKIGSFALAQSSSLIIYAYMSLTEVALYGNYIIITMGMNRVCSSMFNSMGAGVGNLVAESNEEHIYDVFRELFSMRFVLSASVCLAVLVGSQPLVVLWLGSEYLLPVSTLLLITIILFINLARNAVDLFINAYGLFSDIWSPIAEAAINISLAVLLGWLMGMNGILLGVLISLLTIIMGWKPYFMFSRGLKKPIWYFWRDMLIHLAVAITVGFATVRLTDAILPDPRSGWFELIIYTSFTTLLFAVSVSLVLCTLKTGLLQFFRRVASIIRCRKA